MWPFPMGSLRRNNPITMFKKEARNALFTNLQVARRASKLRAITGDLVEELSVNIVT